MLEFIWNKWYDNEKNGHDELKMNIDKVNKLTEITYWKLKRWTVNIEDINQIAFEKMGKLKAHIKREKGFIYYHGLRTAKLALTLRKNIYPDISKYDADILEHQGTTEVWLNFVHSLYEERSYDRAIEWWLKDEKIKFVDGFIKRLEAESEGEIYINSF